MEHHIRIGTRGSKLALWQAHYTQDLLKEIGVSSELVIIKTQGDNIQHLGFDKLEGKGFFTKEIEDALLRGDVDMAVHSMKDMPTEAVDGLVITAVSYRANPADWLIIRKDILTEGKLMRLPEQAVVGTSSARRKAQLLSFRTDLQLKDIRGNVPTRLKKLKKGDYDAIVLAGAGIERLELDLSDFEVLKFNPKEFVPAPAQGVLAWQTAKDDIPTRRILKQLHQTEVANCTNVERKVLNLLEGGCHMPLGVYCEKDQQDNYHVWAAKADTWESPVHRIRLSSKTKKGLAEAVVQRLKSVIHE